MEFKGTKGKWVVKYINDKILIVNENLDRIAVSDTFYSFQEDNFNALLISKAPEMLEMLQYIVDEKDKGRTLDNEDLFNIKQLIKQATEL